jgi:hypothetical protein
MNQEDATRTVNHLFESWGPFLLRYAVRMTRSFEVADDLVQEVFLALYRDLREGKRIDDPKAWTLGAVPGRSKRSRRNSRNTTYTAWPTSRISSACCGPAGTSIMIARGRRQRPGNLQADPRALLAAAGDQDGNRSRLVHRHRNQQRSC